jgi:hypothetical protein
MVTSQFYYIKFTIDTAQKQSRIVPYRAYVFEYFVVVRLIKLYVSCLTKYFINRPKALQNLAMKTKILTMILVCFVLSSCQEQQFFEKEVLANSANNPEKDQTISDSDDNNTDSVIKYRKVTDQFIQDQNATHLNILWVVDNSGSMASSQNNLANNFENFINQFVNKTNLSFEMAITTTDVRAHMQGYAWKNSMEVLTSQKMNQNKNTFIQNFKDLIKVGTNGSAIEAGLEASKIFLNRYSDWSADENAYLIIVYVSDEEDQSPLAPIDYVNFLQAIKTNNPSLVKAYSIVNKSVTYNHASLANGYQRYDFVSQNTYAHSADIFGNFYTALTGIGESIANLVDSFQLSFKPIRNLEVYVDEQLQINTYELIDNEQRIRFHSNALPQANQVIKVQYEIIED